MTTFGIELEFTGITRRKAAEIIKAYLHSNERIASHVLGLVVYDQQGKEWKLEPDSSINASYECQCELVTPVLTETDLPTLKGIVEALKNAGAISSDELGCVLHLHLGSQGHTAQTLRNLVNIMAPHEEQLFKAFGVTKADRTEHFCKKVDTRFLRALNKTKPQIIEELADIWYDTQGRSSNRNDRYNSTRYHALNLHALFCPYRFNTIEFRFGQFCGTTSMDWTTLESFIRICLAMNELAKTIKTASAKPQQNDNPRYAFRYAEKLLCLKILQNMKNKRIYRRFLSIIFLYVTEHIHNIRITTPIFRIRNRYFIINYCDGISNRFWIRFCINLCRFNRFMSKEIPNVY